MSMKPRIEASSDPLELRDIALQLDAEVERMKDAYVMSQNDLLGANLQVQIIMDALKNVPLCAKCHGDGYYLYFNSDGSGADRYDCVCKPLRIAIAKFTGKPAGVKDWAICGWCAGGEDDPDGTCPKCAGAKGKWIERV